MKRAIKQFFTRFLRKFNETIASAAYVERERVLKEEKR
jgi:hypothetical protein